MEPEGAARESFKVVALLAAYNEEDIIAQVVGDLVEQGLLVHFLDHGSTDGTVAAVQPWLGRGLLSIESLAGSGEVRWRDVLRRKEELAAELTGDWFIHQDADEFRESPWPGVNLREAIWRVDRLGFNAIDFELLNFWPTLEILPPGEDVRRAFRHYELGGPYDKLQVRCWKKGAERVDLETSGGHDVAFPRRRVFPVRFLLRHYPLRGQSHAERKIFHERLPRFATAEREGGWHLQYCTLHAGERFVHEPETLKEYDADAVRLHLLLRHRGVEELEARLEAMNQELAGESPEAQQSRQALLADQARWEDLRRGLGEKTIETERLSSELDARNREVLAERERSESLSRELDGRNRELLAERELAAELSRAEASSRAELEALLASRSWRWTRPLRWAQRMLRGG